MAGVDPSGKAVVITGGARGLGAAAAQAVVDGGRCCAAPSPGAAGRAEAEHPEP